MLKFTFFTLNICVYYVIRIYLYHTTTTYNNKDMKKYTNQIQNTIKNYGIVCYEATQEAFSFYAENDGFVVEMDLHSADDYENWNIRLSLNNDIITFSEEEKYILIDLIGSEFDDHLGDSIDVWDNSERFHTEFNAIFNIQ